MSFYDEKTGGDKPRPYMKLIHKKQNAVGAGFIPARTSFVGMTVVSTIVVL
jgi:hypothetical protein